MKIYFMPHGRPPIGVVCRVGSSGSVIVGAPAGKKACPEGRAGRRDSTWEAIDAGMAPQVEERLKAVVTYSISIMACRRVACVVRQFRACRRFAWPQPPGIGEAENIVTSGPYCRMPMLRRNARQPTALGHLVCRCQNPLPAATGLFEYSLVGRLAKPPPYLSFANN